MRRYMAIILTIFFLFGTCSCGIDTAAIVFEAETTVSKAGDSLKNGDFITASNYLDMRQLEDAIKRAEPCFDTYYNFDEFMEKWFASVKIDIISSEFVNENSVNVNTDISSLSMEEVYIKFMEELITSLEELKASINGMPTPSRDITEIIDNILNGLSKKTTTSVTLTLSNNNGEWQIQISDQLVNAILGDRENATKIVNEACEKVGFKVEELEDICNMVDEYLDVYGAN